MPTFCRHNRLVQNCPICAREQHVEMREVVSASTPRAKPSASTPSARPKTRAGVRIRQLDRAADDGYRSDFAPGLRASADAERLAEELAFAAERLRRLSVDPPGLYAEVARDGDVEERLWLAFLIAYVCPLDGPDPFPSIRAARTTWASGELPDLDAVETGPRTAHDATHGRRTIEAYRAWARRAGSQAHGFTGEQSWSAERRFARVFERLAMPGLHRDARFDLLVTVGRLGVVDVRAAALEFGAAGDVTLAAKRLFGIGDPLLLERRAEALAAACAVPLEALDLALYNWSRGERAGLGMASDSEPDPTVVAGARGALGL